MIRVAFRYGDRRIFSRLVCFVRGGDTAHCEVSDDWTGGDHSCVSSSWVDGGVRRKIINLTRDKWRVYQIPGDPSVVSAWMRVHGSDGYGVFRLLRFVLNLRINWGGPVCSTAAADIMGISEPYLFDPRTLEAVCDRLGTRVPI